MNLLTLIQRTFGVKSAQATCGACGKPFECGASLRGCWCAEIKLTDAQRAEIRSRYPGCLCRECLEEFSSAATRK